VPPNSTATVHVPAARAESVREGGRPVAKAAGVRRVGWADGHAVFEIGSGDYEFTSTL
jgi:alpha-L-rhamnosidase